MTINHNHLKKNSTKKLIATEQKGHGSVFKCVGELSTNMFRNCLENLSRKTFLSGNCIDTARCSMKTLIFHFDS